MDETRIERRSREGGVNWEGQGIGNQNENVGKREELRSEKEEEVEEVGASLEEEEEVVHRS